jgi:hypothetical protein
MLIEDRDHVLYYIEDVKTSEVYIGVTALLPCGSVFKSLQRRMQRHRYRAFNELGHYRLCKALRSRGVSRFVYGVIDVVPGKRAAYDKEQQLIKTLRPEFNMWGL